MKKSLVLSLSILLFATAAPSYAAKTVKFNNQKAGQSCKTLELNSNVNLPTGAVLTCTKANAKAKPHWVQSKAPATKTTTELPTTTPTAAPTPTPTPTQSTAPQTKTNSLIPAINSVNKVEVVAYPSNVIASDKSAAKSSLVIPSQITTAPAGTNVKLWISDPRSPASGLVGSGIFYWQGSNPAKYVPANPDGSLYLSLPLGTYAVDTVEGPGLASVMSRHRYSLIVSSPSASSIADVTADSRGISAITTDLIVQSNPTALAEYNRLMALATESAGTFVPTSACQLKDAVTPNRSFGTDLSAGNPKVRIRQKSYGHIKALIVPVDFTDIKGTDNTVSYFTPVANGVRDFYYSQSYGRVSFDFAVVPNWVHVPFSSKKYGTGGSVGAGDPNGYLNEVISLTDPEIDYSKYDAVYFLVPKEMPMANMGWGPAITSPHTTSTGVIVNGATGGADMYYVENTGIKGGRWKWMAHETGHTFGLYDEDNHHQTQSLGYWNIMAMSWSNQAIEIGAWDRYLQGWLTDQQVGCVTKDSLTTNGTAFTLDPLVRQDEKQKSVMIPLSDTKMLVMESRRNEGLDILSAKEEGLIVYTVDVSIGQLGGGYVIHPRSGFTDTQGFTDAALHAGDSITVDGVKITVTAADKNGDTVKVGI